LFFGVLLFVELFYLLERITFGLLLCMWR